MKKKLKRKKRRQNRLKFLLFCVIFFLSFKTAYQKLEESHLKIDDQVIAKYLLQKQNHHIKKETSLLGKVKETITNPTFLLGNNYRGLVQVEKKIKQEKTKVEEREENPLVYIYNTHQTEEYAPSSIAEYAVNPTVLVGSYILEEKLQEKGFHSIVEERSIKEMLNLHQWNYTSSYDASRIYLDDVKHSYPTIRYFIDFHRDSIAYEKTTMTLGDKKYAKLLFLIGLENPNYQKNMAFTEQIVSLLNEKYPGLCKGIYQKGGPGVNGIYNQDNSEYTILVEVGGKDNKIEEVFHSVEALSEVLSEVISIHESKEYS